MLINPLIHINPTGWMTIPASPIYPIYHVLTMAWVCPKMRDGSMALRPEKSMFSNIKTRYISPLFGPYMCLKSLEMSFSLSPEPQGLWKPRRNPFKTPRRAADVAKAQASNPISWQSWGSQVVGFHSRIEVTNPSIPS